MKHSTLALALAALVLCPPVPAGTHAAPDRAREAATLAAVLETVRAAAARGETPMVVFDLDDTLFDAGSRTLRILREYAVTPPARAACPALFRRLAGLRAADMAYDTAANLSRHGLESCPDAAGALAFWKARFFTDAYCAKDAPNPGARAYVARLHGAGARIVYLTGRDAPGMLQGTRESLARHGFPLGAGTELILKPRFEDDDTAFKESVFARLAAAGRVVACFENEPKNLNAMQRAFPGAHMVFLDTRHSPKPDRPAPGIPWVKDYRAGI